MKRHLITAAVAALVVLMAVPAMAAPWNLQALPDADMFCGANYADEVDGFTGNPNSGTLWIEDDVYGGHYVIVMSDHYLAEGLLYGPQEEPYGFPLGERHFGAKMGTTDRIECQVVSRWAVPDAPFTVIAPVELARVS